MTKKWVLSGALVALAVILALYVPWGGESASTRSILRGSVGGGRSADHLDLTGRPLFSYGDLYLDGRSSWVAARFAADRERFRALSAPVDLTVEARVLGEPFTSGVWVEALGEKERDLRRSVETNTVESELTFLVPDVSPERLVLFLAGSRFVEHAGSEGEYEREDFFPPLPEPPEGLRDLPSFEPNQFLSRELWRGKFGALPTAVYYLNELEALGDIHVLVYEVWRDIGGEGHATVRMSSGQYAVRAVDGGSLVHLHHFYNGQGFPDLMAPFVVETTKAFYRNLVRVIRERSRDWEPGPEFRRWAAGRSRT